MTTVSERLAERLADPVDLRFLPHPVDLPEVAINLFWHAKVHRSPAHLWLRGLVFDLFGEDKTPGPSPDRLAAVVTSR